MISIHPRNDSISQETLDAYRAVASGTLGHLLDTAMDGSIAALWKPVKLVGLALTVQSVPGSYLAVAKATEVAKPGDVLVVNRAGETRHATTGEFGSVQAMEAGIAGMVTDGPITDRAAIKQIGFPVFCTGSVAMVTKPKGLEEGAINVPVQVGGITVNPGDLILADDDGVIVATPQEALECLLGCQQAEAWEAYAREQIAFGRKMFDFRDERPGFIDAFRAKLQRGG
jgi:4-hydroxy-4-methyl-2-oxoglutarate aldolase